MTTSSKNRYIYAFSRRDSSLKKGLGSDSGNIVDTIFIICSIAGFAAAAVIGVTLLLVAMDKIEV